MKGGQLRRSNFSKTWASGLAEAGLPAEVHVHDLRHTGNTFAAETGASLAELMNRVDHSSTKAAQVYPHAREERGQQIAATLDKMARRELSRAPEAPPRGPGGGRDIGHGSPRRPLEDRGNKPSGSCPELGSNR
ncbi:MAG: tyrosine-type recombinase/integrase [Streptosporangiaceae bacterium]